MIRADHTDRPTRSSCRVEPEAGTKTRHTDRSDAGVALDWLLQAGQQNVYSGDDVMAIRRGKGNAAYGTLRDEWSMAIKSAESEQSEEIRLYTGINDDMMLQRVRYCTNTSLLMHSRL